MGQGRRQFTDEFKREAVALLASSGRPLMQIATELGIVPSMLRNWRDRNGGRNAGPTPVSSAAPPPHSAADPAAEILPPSPRERSAADGARYSKKNCGHLDWRSCAGSAAVFAKRSSPMATRSALRTCDGGSLKNIAVVADGVLAALDALLIVKQRFRPG